EQNKKSSLCVAARILFRGFILHLFSQPHEIQSRGSRIKILPLCCRENPFSWLYTSSMSQPHKIQSYGDRIKILPLFCRENPFSWLYTSSISQPHKIQSHGNRIKILPLCCRENPFSWLYTPSILSTTRDTISREKNKNPPFVLPRESFFVA